MGESKMITDCGAPTHTRFCREHNVADCAVCIKVDGACDHGGCHKPATFRVKVIATRTERVVEVRPLCIPHMVDFTSRTDGGAYAFEAVSL